MFSVFENSLEDQLSFEDEISIDQIQRLVMPSFDFIIDENGQIHLVEVNGVEGGMYGADSLQLQLDSYSKRLAPWIAFDTKPTEVRKEILVKLIKQSDLSDLTTHFNGSLHSVFLNWFGTSSNDTEESNLRNALIKRIQQFQNFTEQKAALQSLNAFNFNNVNIIPVEMLSRQSFDRFVSLSPIDHVVIKKSTGSQGNEISIVNNYVEAIAIVSIRELIVILGKNVEDTVANIEIVIDPDDESNLFGQLLDQQSSNFAQRIDTLRKELSIQFKNVSSFDDVYNRVLSEDNLVSLANAISDKNITVTFDHEEVLAKFRTNLREYLVSPYIPSQTYTNEKKFGVIRWAAVGVQYKDNKTRKIHEGGYNRLSLEAADVNPTQIINYSNEQAVPNEIPKDQIEAIVKASEELITFFLSNTFEAVLKTPSNTEN